MKRNLLLLFFIFTLTETFVQSKNWFSLMCTNAIVDGVNRTSEYKDISFIVTNGAQGLAFVITKGEEMTQQSYGPLVVNKKQTLMDTENDIKFDVYECIWQADNLYGITHEPSICRLTIFGDESTIPGKLPEGVTGFTIEISYKDHKLSFIGAATTNTKIRNLKDVIE